MYEELTTEERAGFDPSVLLDARDVLDAGVEADLPVGWVPSASDSFEAGLQALEAAAVHARVLVADQYRMIAEALDAAADDPEPWVGPDPTLDPHWLNPRGQSVATVRHIRGEVAVRAAAADIGVRLRMAESTVHARAAAARALRARCPRVWAAFQSGRGGEANATTAAQLAGSLPEDAGDSWAAFDEGVSAGAESLTAGKFRTHARVVRERVHAESLEQRHRRAVDERSVWVTAELDGMATFSALLPAVDAYSALARVNAAAVHLGSLDGETRTRAQLRADALIDLLAAPPADDPALDGYTPAHSPAPATSTASSPAPATTTPRSRAPATSAVPPVGPVPIPAVVPTVAITVPVMTLLGRSDEPAMLEGYGPIDPDTAREWAGEATSWVRILTHPITGTVLDVDRTTYRVPTALRRWLQVRHPSCVFPGCRRPSRECDVDHSIDWQRGGRTSPTTWRHCVVPTTR